VDSIARGVLLAPEMRTRMFRSQATGDGDARSAVPGIHAAPDEHVQLRTSVVGYRRRR
jgi:hypothetical protein